MDQPIFNQIQIMTKSGCNLKCSFCPNNYLPETDHEMEDIVFEKIINELLQLEYSGRITLYLMNEPFRDSRLPQLVETTRNACPNARINIITNGVLPTHEDMKELFDCGLTDADISCYTNFTWDKWRRFKLSNNLNTNAMNFNVPDLPRYLGMNNRGGNVPGIGSPSKVGVGYCDRPFVQMYINSQGQSILCCSDYKYEVIMGDVKDNTLMEIWNNSKYEQYRNSLQNKIRKGLTLCERCNF
jgi:radical SAM protein with 4Fe4S-binding SPASM domain